MDVWGFKSEWIIIDYINKSNREKWQVIVVNKEKSVFFYTNGQISQLHYTNLKIPLIDDEQASKWFAVEFSSEHEKDK